MKKKTLFQKLLLWKKSTSFKQASKYVLALLLVCYCLTLLWGVYKPLPDGVSIESDMYYVSDEQITFLSDITYKNTTEQEIFAGVFDIIDSAEEYLVLDMFLFGSSPESKYVPVASQLTDALLTKRAENLSMPIVFVTDYFNTFYGSYKTDEIQQLEEHNISIVFTNMNRMRDSNPLYTSFWRMFIQPFGSPSFTGGVIDNPLGNGSVSIRSVLALPNFKANHRKIILNENEAIISSANPHDASSLHSNVAIRIQDKRFISDMIDAEQAIARISQSSFPSIEYGSITLNNSSAASIGVKYLTEGKIRDAIVQEIASATAQDTIKIGMFYFSERDIVDALKQAAKRGVSIELILDANKDAFGREKNGIPNRPVAHELREAGAKIAWYDTHGEQFHTKIFIKEQPEHIIIILGSGNYTKRNIADYNFEANIYVIAPRESIIAQEVTRYWERISEYTLAYEAYEDDSLFKYLLYRVQEKLGLSTF
jgi:phosphatidylserine/phosphatidylglycerophosphate/cardiolipin synthase-like enzyme